MEVRAYLLLVAACGSDATPPAKPTPTVPPPSPVAPVAPPASWKLTLQSDYGPCDPSDKRSCHKSWTVTSDGSIMYVEHPNDNGPASTTTSTMAAADRDRLVALLKTREFEQGMANGFACEGQGREYDASLRLIFEQGGTTSRQYILRCVRDATTVPGEIDVLIRR